MENFIPPQMTSSSDPDSDDDSEYIPSPLQRAQLITPCNIPHHCVLLDLSQVEQFINQVNQARTCKTAGCKGKLVPQDVMTCAMGGAVTITYMCDGCLDRLVFQTSSTNTQVAKTDIQLAAQVAFITAGCTYTYYLRQGLPAYFGHQTSKCESIHDDYRNSTSNSRSHGE